MCGLCGALRVPHWSDVLVGRRERLLRLRVLGDVLAELGLTVRDWEGQLVLSDRKGRSQISASLDDVWISVAALSGCFADPLELFGSGTSALV